MVTGPVPGAAYDDRGAGGGRRYSGLSDSVGGHQPPLFNGILPPTSKRFAAHQSHWFRVADDKLVEYWATRDDLPTLLQLGIFQPPGRPPEGISLGKVTLLGAVLGLAWGAGLRGWMAVVAGGLPSFSWSGTFIAILLPATLVGAALGWAEYARRTGGQRAWRWTALTPLLFVVMPALVQDGFVTELLTTGIGGGAVGVALIGIIGGYAIAGRGPRWARWLSRTIMAALLVASVITALIGGFGHRMTPAGAYTLLTFIVFCGLLAAACAIPHLPAPDKVVAGSN
jgi:hypothetical protein